MPHIVMHCIRFESNNEILTTVYAVIFSSGSGMSHDRDIL